MWTSGMNTNFQPLLGEYNRTLDELQVALKGDLGNERMVAIPTTGGGIKNVTVEFDKEQFTIVEENDRIKRVSIPEGIRVTQNQHGLELTRAGRTIPLRIFKSDDVAISARNGEIILACPKEKDPKLKMVSPGRMNLGIFVRDLLATFTYLRGFPDEADAGAGSVMRSANAPGIRAWHRAIISPEIRKELEKE